MISDKASTYLSAADERKQLFQSPSLKKAFSDRGIEWEFIPKRAPWYGVFWERLIGMTKTVIKKVLGRARISLIIEIEAVLNDRPLTYVSSDVNDPEPLTPANLLYGRRMPLLPYPDVGRRSRFHGRF
jgi:transposase InsO family protein